MPIAQTPQTDPRNFPTWRDKAPPGQSGSEYPKMLTRPCTKQDRDEWLVANQKRDTATREPYFDAVAPKIGAPIPCVATAEMVDDGLAAVVGEPLIAGDADEERRLRDYLAPELESERSEVVAIPLAEPKVRKLRRKQQ